MKYSPDKELNALGFICPYPIIETSKMIKNIEVGEIIAIKADDLAIILDMPAWCHSNGHEYLGEEKLTETKGYIVYVKKGSRKN